jgi:lysyl-tRNA synthetase class 2
MVFTEHLVHYLCDTVLGTQQVDYQGTLIDFSKPFVRMSVKEALLTYHHEVTSTQLESLDACRSFLDSLGLAYQKTAGLGKLHMIAFEETIEHQLLQPTFITGYPTEISPLARRSNEDPEVTDRFEFFVAGRELANGFSELNDAEDQAERFRKQVLEKDSGDLEAMHFDSDYIEALEYGLPPTAGEGIGIDRLVMLFTNAQSIRDVILFPQLRV